MILKISPGNNKLGSIPSINLPPVITCRKDAPCFQECNARATCGRWKHPDQAYKDNLWLWYQHPDIFEAELFEYIQYNRPELFRVHTSGDMPNLDYRNMILRISDYSPATKFLMFTKKYTFAPDRLIIPDNLTIINSIWPGLEMPTNHRARAYYQDGTETRVENALPCSGHCDQCGICWNLKTDKTNIIFYKKGLKK